ncbi:DUF2806 domain-containing protein [Citrobacter freundii]|uniref:DUF2806 domain-containing protein n=1 Tax=Citrobacter freundii TaxID=546 RepID=UPI0015E9B9CB|nr:DUF2806 domain-containing protein [Citrobacter freundii]QLX27407.1 DUF2806 domain-containing protein [Citrobacter freundii]
MPDENTGLQIFDAVQKYAKPVLSLAKAIGPFILAQSKLASENYENFKLNKERLEALSVFLREESQRLAEERSQLRKLMFESNGLERVQAEHNYNLLTRELNKLSTIDKIKDFIKHDEDIQSSESISDVWVEQFNKLASSLNEEWRKQLLAKAFATELKNPGAMSLVVLNSIGNFDEKSFRYFGALINRSIRMQELNLLPIGSKTMSAIYDIDGELVSRSTIEYSLAHLNLIDDSDKRVINVIEKKPTYFRYGRRVLVVTTKTNISSSPGIPGKLFTPLGNSIAQLYDREIIPDGNENLNFFFDYIKNEREAVYSIGEIELSDADYEYLGN